MGSSHVLSTCVAEITTLGKLLAQMCLTLPRCINGYLVGSYERRVWLHPAICYCIQIMIVLQRRSYHFAEVKYSLWTWIWDCIVLVWTEEFSILSSRIRRYKHLSLRSYRAWNSAAIWRHNSSSYHLKKQNFPCRIGESIFRSIWHYQTLLKVLLKNLFSNILIHVVTISTRSILGLL